MNRLGIGLLAAWAALAAGCEQGGAGGVGEDASTVERGVEDRTPYEQLDLTADTSEDYQEEGAAPVTVVQGGRTIGGALTATGNLRGIADDAPPGTITVTEAGPGTLVSITITRYTADTQLEVSLVRGQCGASGEPVVTLPETIQVDSDGVAALEARVDMPTRQLLDGNHSVRVHNPGATPSGESVPEMVLACADLPAADPE